jgi:hypothetical protein
MSQRLFNVAKIGLTLDDYGAKIEKRRSGEVKVIELTLRVQPFDSKLARAIDDGVGGDSNVRTTLFKSSENAEPKPHLRRVNFELGCPRQNLIIYASPDTVESRMSFQQVKISGTYARVEKGIDGYAWVFRATYGPVGRAELEYIHEWKDGQRFITFEASEPDLEFEAVGDDEVDESATDADEKARQAAPIWEGEGEAPPAAREKNREVGARQRLHSHQGGKGRRKTDKPNGRARA